MAAVHPQDVVILHDPQTAGLTEQVRRRGATVIWRCHVGLDHANENAREAWRFLLPYVLPAHAFVFSRAGFAWEGLPRRQITVIRPSIDAFSPKNAEQSTAQSLAILAKASVLEHRADDRPRFTRPDGRDGEVQRQAVMYEDRPTVPDDRVILQVSRWDTLKDPLGVLNGFAQNAEELDGAHLMLAGPTTEAVADDPEGAAVFAAVQMAWRELPGAVRRRVHLAYLPMDDPDENAAIVNALQRHASVVVQKSLAEGFGLTVAEAMWKARPVVASRIGGIRDQIVDGESGLLLSDPRDLREFGNALAALVHDRDLAQRIGVAAHASVQEHFLGPNHLGRYFEVISRLLAARAHETAPGETPVGVGSPPAPSPSRFIPTPVAGPLERYSPSEGCSERRRRATPDEREPTQRQPHHADAPAEASWRGRHPAEEGETTAPPAVPEDEDSVPNRHSASAEAALLRWRETHDES